MPNGARYLRFGRSAGWSLAALVTGLGLGLLLHRSQEPWVVAGTDTLRSAGRLWIHALQLVVVPVVVTQVIVALLRTSRLGVLGLRTLLVFLAMLLVTMGFTLLVAPPVFALYEIDRGTLQALLAGVAAPEATPQDAAAPSNPGWLGRLFLGEYLLFVLLGSAAFALMLRRIGGRALAILQPGFERAAALVNAVVGGLLLLAPLGILALSFALARGAGGSALGLLTVFVLAECLMTVALIVLLYPATAVLGGVPVRRFVRALAPPQAVGMSTRSSLAALPAMVQAARELHLPPGAAGFVLPFALATVKISRAMSAPLKLVFLAYALGIPLGPERLLPFLGGILLLSFVVPGLPGRGPEAATLPLYAAAGIPLEGIVVLEAVDAIADMFKTVLNVTSTMSAAAIVTHPDTATAGAS